jgi:hypothetical protein
METYHPSKKPDHHWLKKHKRLIIFMVFLAILSFLIFTSFSDISFTGSMITGNVIIEGLTPGGTVGEGIEFKSEFSTIPDLIFKGEFEKIELSGNSNSFLKVGNQKLSLEKVSNNLIIFDNFNGEISLNYGQITKLNGRASGVTLNGVSIFPLEEESAIKVSFGDEFNYGSLEIGRGVSIGEINYVTSGTIRLNGGKEIFSVNNEEIIINDFYGSLLINNGKFKIEGDVGELGISGESNINIQA